MELSTRLQRAFNKVNPKSESHKFKNKEKINQKIHHSFPDMNPSGNSGNNKKQSRDHQKRKPNGKSKIVHN